MTRRFRLYVFILLAIISTAPALADEMLAYVWRGGDSVTYLGVLPGYTSSVARGISESGVVVGYSYRDDGSVGAFSWTDSTGLVGLNPLPGGANSAAYGVNNFGQAVGYSTDASGESRAVLWNPDGTIVDLGTLLQDNTGSSVAFAINDNGLIVGTADAPRGDLMTSSQAFSWTISTGMADLGRANESDVASSARAVNNAGLIAGRSSLNADWSYAYLISDQGWTPLGDGTANGLNDSGVVVGNDGSGHGFMYDPLHGVSLLSPLPGGLICQATGINAGGQIVGNSTNADGHTDATIWNPDGTTTDLGALVGSSYRSVAYAINVNGDVVGGLAVPGLPGIFTLSFGVGLVALRRRYRG